MGYNLEEIESSLKENLESIYELLGESGVPESR